MLSGYRRVTGIVEDVDAQSRLDLIDGLLTSIAASRIGVGDYWTHSFTAIAKSAVAPRKDRRGDVFHWSGSAGRRHQRVESLATTAPIMVSQCSLSIVVNGRAHEGRFCPSRWGYLT